MNKIWTISILSLLILTACQPAENNGQSTQSVKSTDSDTTVNLTIKDDQQKPILTEQTTMSQIQQSAMPQAGDQIAILKTNKGDIKIRLFPELVPETVKNFTQLASEGKYANVPFHRVIRDFMIQTGDFESKNGLGGYSYKGVGTVIEDEFSPALTHIPYSVSMANKGPNTGGSQFFIVSTPQGTPWLNGKHAIFGQVYEGKEIVDQIQSAETDMSDRPLDEILIKSVEVGKY